ncbi:MAG TPA: transglutaminaseTgpA domain-containing protein [Thermoleophilaceae bacterium]|nr:transglutaminaseTgpA domain-containing protein [Thermoleophilaceae bacterium]
MRSRSTETLQLALFAALGAFAALHWASLVASPPVARILLAVAVVTAAGALMGALNRSRLPRPAVHAVALVIVLVAGAAALSVTGLSVRLLWPRNWNEFGVELDQGLSGVQTVVWPYDGPEESVRLAILLGAPALLTLAAALAFWPVRSAVTASVLRFMGLVALLCLYVVPVTDHDPGSPLLRGLVLFALVAAWLWAPRMGRRELVPALVAVAAVGLVALPLAARVDRADALVDYSDWNWFGGKEITFDWNHSYGPLDWPRDGTTLLQVRSPRPLYWKAEVLDTFDGLRWVRSRSNDRTSPLGELPDDPDTRWDRSIRVTVRSLRTDFVIGTGTPYRVLGAGEAVSGSADGTLRRLTEPLRRGDTYTVRAYAPTPDADQMRAAPARYEPELTQYTDVVLPRRGENALDTRNEPGSTAARDRIEVPLRSDDAEQPASPGPARFAGSPYARTERLARSLTEGTPTVYDAVRRVQDHFRSSRFTYSERPPSRRYPLAAFLFQDRIGYCQQFSGAMALMLRMSGIPARVATGFSPGSLNRDTGEYRVRDLDAHSWVEVYFSDIGWVTFDPTPPAAPADRAGQGPRAAPEGEDRAREANSDDGDSPLSDRAADTSGGARGGGSGDGGGPPAGVLVAFALAALGGGVYLMAHRRMRPHGTAEAGLAELERALPRLGWKLPAGTTLLQLEQRLRRAAGPASARYVGQLRARRYGPGQEDAPPRADRRAVRRELTAGGGFMARLRGFAALPPRRRTG